MEIFLEQHLNQLKNSRIPSIYWEALQFKLENEIFDAGNCFMIQQLIEIDEAEENEICNLEYHLNNSSKYKNLTNDVDDNSVKWRAIVNIETGIDHEDDHHIYLIDHAWTYRPEDARRYLKESRNLLERMFSLMYPQLQFDEHQNNAEEMVLKDMWKFNQTYNIANEKLGCESAVPIWYIMDEFGSSIEHSHFPNVSIVPFCYVPTMITYSVLWPLRNLINGETLFRDFLNGQSSLIDRNLRLIPWIKPKLDEIEFFDKIEYFSLFNDKFSVHTSLPSEVKPSPLEGQLVKIFSDIDQIVANLSDSNFKIVTSIDDADILWLKEPYSDFRSYSLESPNKYINQFPFEMLLTVKNMLAIICRRLFIDAEHSFDGCIITKFLENKNDVNFPWQSPIILPTTFDLNHELQLFVFYFNEREKRNLENYWIIKPYNLARSLDTHITNNLIEIIRLIETGPKVACKYLSEPVLLYREDLNCLVKFDLRFVVLLKSVKPLQLYIHDKFIVRVANKMFEMNEFDDYEKHFTVMNYKKNIQMKEMTCEDFISMFNNQYKEHNWDYLLSKIKIMLRSIFEAASSLDPPKGIAVSPQSRAIYGADIMLRWVDKVQEPVILEINYGPDNTRLFKRYPDFYNQTFNNLFLNKEYETIIKI